MRTAPSYQEDYLPFDHLLFFGAPGVDGIQFAFGIIQGEVKREDVYAWYPIDDGRPWLAPSLKTFIEWWGAGRISL